LYLGVKTISENTIEPFLIASYSKDMLWLLKFLFMPPTLFQPSPEIRDLLVLPEVEVEKLKEYYLAKELIVSKTKYRVGKTLISFSELMNKIIKEAIISVFTYAKEKKLQREEEISIMATSLVATKVKKYFEKEFHALVSRAIIPLLQSLSEGLTISLADFIIEKWLSLSRLEPEYTKILSVMKKLGRVTPLLQVIVCPYCLLTSLTISESVVDINYCPKCGRKPLIGTLYVLSEDLAKLKRAREDVIYFIATYLKYKPLEKFPLIMPSIKIKHYVGEVEVDVYVKELNYGIECKVFDPVEVISSERMENWLRELKGKVNNYEKAGIKQMLIVTNLKEEIIDSLKAELVDYAKEKSIILEDVLGANPEKLLEKLNSIVERITEKLQEDMRKEMEARLKLSKTASK